MFQGCAVCLSLVNVADAPVVFFISCVRASERVKGQVKERAGKREWQAIYMQAVDKEMVPSMSSYRR